VAATFTAPAHAAQNHAEEALFSITEPGKSQWSNKSCLFQTRQVQVPGCSIVVSENFNPICKVRSATTDAAQ